MTPAPKISKSIGSALSGFLQFIKEQNVVGLAVGIILGSSAKGVVDALVADIFNPLIGLLLGGANLGNKAICLAMVGGKCKNMLAWGHFLTVLIQFVIVAAVVYFVVNKTVALFANRKS